jgi:hypothetical protein
VREIVKRETIETSIVGGRSASRWGNPAWGVVGRPRVSVSLVLLERGRRKVGLCLVFNSL